MFMLQHSCYYDHNFSHFDQRKHVCVDANLRPSHARQFFMSAIASTEMNCGFAPTKTSFLRPVHQRQVAHFLWAMGTWYMAISSNDAHTFATHGRIEFNLPVLGVFNEPLDVIALQHYGDIIPNLVLSEPRQMPMRIGWLHVWRQVRQA